MQAHQYGRFPRGFALLGGIYRRFTEITLVLTPCWIFLYLNPCQLPHGPNLPLFAHLLFAAFTTLIGLTAAYFAWRGYRVSREVSLRWMALGFLGAGLSDLLHSLSHLFPSVMIFSPEILGSFSRLQLAVAIFLGIVRYQAKIERLEMKDVPKFEFRWVLALILGNVMVTGIPFIFGLSSSLVAKFLSAMIVLVALGGIVAAFVRKIDTPVMNTLIVSLALLAQASVPYYLGEQWDSFWWLALAIYSLAYLVLGYGLVRAYLAAKSITAIYTRGTTIPRLIAAREETERRASPLHAASEPSPPAVDLSISGLMTCPRLLARADAEFARSRVTQVPLTAIGLAIRHWEDLRSHHEAAAMLALRKGFVGNVMVLLRPLEVMAADGENRYYVLLPDTDLPTAHRTAEWILTSIASIPVAATTFALRLQGCASIVQFGRDGVSPEEVLAVASKRLDIALEKDHPNVVGPIEV